MKKLAMIAWIFILTAGLMAGCFGRRDRETTPATTTASTAAPTVPTTRPHITEPTMPSMEDVIPGTEDTIDPESGENGETIDPDNGSNKGDKDARRKASPKF